MLNRFVLIKCTKYLNLFFSSWKDSKKDSFFTKHKNLADSKKNDSNYDTYWVIFDTLWFLIDIFRLIFLSFCIFFFTKKITSHYDSKNESIMVCFDSIFTIWWSKRFICIHFDSIRFFKSYVMMKNIFFYWKYLLFWLPKWVNHVF